MNDGKMPSGLDLLNLERARQHGDALASFEAARAPGGAHRREPESNEAAPAHRHGRLALCEPGRRARLSGPRHRCHGHHRLGAAGGPAARPNRATPADGDPDVAIRRLGRGAPAPGPRRRAGGALRHHARSRQSPGAADSLADRGRRHGARLCRDPQPADLPRPSCRGRRRAGRGPGAGAGLFAQASRAPHRCGAAGAGRRRR